MNVTTVGFTFACVNSQLIYGKSPVNNECETTQTPGSAFQAVRYIFQVDIKNQ